MSQELQEQIKGLPADVSLHEGNNPQNVENTVVPDWTPEEERRVVRL